MQNLMARGKGPFRLAQGLRKFQIGSWDGSSRNRVDFDRRTRDTREANEEVLTRHCRGKKVPLRTRAAQLAEEFELPFGLHTFDHHVVFESARQFQD